MVSVVFAVVLLVGMGAAAFVALGGETEGGGSAGISGMVTTAVPLTTTEHDIVGGDDPARVPVPTLALAPDEADLVHVSLAPAIDLLTSEVGGSYRVEQLVVYPGYLVATIEPPDLPGELDRWVVYVPDRVTGPDPQSNPGDISGDLFDPAELDLSVLAGLPERAIAELGIEPETTYLIIERSSAHGGQLTVSVYISNDRRSGYARFTTEGGLLDVHGA